MCGIAGFYTLNADQSRAECHAIAQKMIGMLHHRGPDAGDVWQDPECKIILAHRRLSIIDLSPAGAQPMASASGRYVITYNGEFYNYSDLQRELESFGVVFKGRSDTEIFLAALEQWGINRALQKINGMFAFALWDRKDKQLHLVRDRLGKKPLYIGWAGKNLVFGSELKALRAHPEFKASLNTQALGQYFQKGWLSAPDCIYDGVWMLKPAHRITLDLTALKAQENLEKNMHPYWHPIEIVLQNQGLREQYTSPQNTQKTIAHFEDLLQRCTSERMSADVPLGAFLSGGIDSSCVVALMQKERFQPVKTYTIGFVENAFNEAEHARQIARYLGTDHHELILSPDQTLSVIPKLPDIFDEPFADISAIPTYFVSQFARRDVTVVLSGDGGDEMLGGYARHLYGPRLARRIALIPESVRVLLARLIQKIPVVVWNRIHPSHPQFGRRIHKAASILQLANEREIYTRLIHSGDISLLLEIKPEVLIADVQISLSMEERMMLWDTLGYLPGSILTKVDRASMATSLEARAPLLDYRIFEYVWQLPLAYKIRNGKGKWLLREVLARYLPRTFFDRTKQGFEIPVGDWLRGPLKEWAESLLCEDIVRQDEHLHVSKIRDLWLEHQKGMGNHTQSLWIVLMYQSWKNRWM